MLQPNIIPGGSVRAFSLRFWILVLLTGIGAGLMAGALMLLLHGTQHFFWSYSSGTFLQAVERHGATRRVLVLVAAGVVAGVYRWLLKLNQGGHGAEVNEAIWFRSGRIAAIPTVVRAALSIVLVGMGASLGREAAPKQAGAAIASTLAGWARVSPTERRLLAAFGLGAGMGAVYNVPFGGALFALEVILGSLALPLIPPALAASTVATGISWLMLPNAPTYQVPAYHFAVPEALWAAWAGPLAGLAAVLYIRAISWADARKPKGWERLLAPILVFTALGALALEYPQLLGNGRDIVQQMFLGQVGLPLLLAVLFLKPLATTSCLGSGAPGGLFTPTITFGAALGGVLGRGWGMLWPGAPVASYAILGAAAVLAASMQGPISAFVLIAELTHRLDLVLPMLLVIAAAAATTRLCERRSIYSGRIHLGRSAAGSREAPRATAFEDLLARDLRTVSAATPYPEMLRELARRGGEAASLYVVDETGSLLGVIPGERLTRGQRDNPLVDLATAADLTLPVRPLPSSATREEALQRLAAERAGSVPVVDDSGGPIGLIRLPQKGSG